MRLLNSSWIQRPLLAAVLGAVSACGGGQTSVAKVEIKDFDAARYLLDYAESSTAILKPETDSLDALGDELRVTRTGTARRDLERRVAAGKLKEAMAAPTPKEARLLRNEANKLLRQSKKGERDSFHLAESEFLELWSAWLGGADDTERMATAYTENR
ncbi:MAG: hypothetical protein KC417_13570, partial [Myxococcales bacterium]|nr:hypothetical protein [Myxococcales bacterium]